LLPGPAVYPEYGLNRRLGCPQRLSGCYEDDRKFFHCFKLMDDSLVIQPQLLVKLAVARQVKKLPTLLRAWTFILG
jgi:hypothetical protein